MSILFDALNKAARDYRKQKVPLSIPLVKTPAAQGTRKGFKAAFLSACAMALVGGAFAIIFDAATSPESNLGKPPILADKDSSPVRDIAVSEEALHAQDIDLVSSEIEKTNALTNYKASPRRGSMLVTHEGVSLKQKMEQAALLVDKKDWNAALKLYNEILKANPIHEGARDGKIYVYAERKWDDDLIALDQLAIHWPTNHKIHAARARILATQKQPIASLAAWKQAYNLAPQNPDYALALAVTLDRLGRKDEAIAIYRTMTKPLPNNAQKRYEYLMAQYVSE